MSTSGWKNLGLSCLVALAACGPGQQEDALEFRIPVKVESVQRGTVEDLMSLTGTLRSERIINLSAETRGVLQIAIPGKGRALAEGDRVVAGQLIAELTGEDVRVASRTESTRQRFLQASSDLKAKRKLFDGGLITDTELRAAETAVSDAKLEYDRSRLTEKRSRLITPIDGRILRLARDSSGGRIAEGQLLDPGQVVAQIAPTNPMLADVAVMGKDIGRIAVGQEVRVSSIAFSKRNFQGHVLRLAPSVDEISRTLRAEIEVENTEGLLKPGLFVRAEVLVDRHVDVPVVPRAAVVERAAKRVVFVAEGTSVEQREVVTGLGNDEIVEIVSGVKAGENIVVQGLETLAAGSKIRIRGS